MAHALIRRTLTAVFFMVFLWPAAWAQALQPVPALTAQVIDHTGALSSAEIAALNARLAGFEQEKGAQIVVLMVPTTAPEDIASYANRIANDWKIGRKGVGDGLLLIVAKDDRKLRIEVAKTLEGAIPDLAAKQIIDEAIAPHFKQGRYAAGLDAGVDLIFARIRGEPLPAPVPAHQGSSGSAAGEFSWENLGIFLFLALPVGAALARAIFGRTLGTLLLGCGVGLLAYVLSSSLWLALAAGVVALVWGALGAGSRSPGSGLGGLGGLGRGSTSGGWGGGAGGFSSGGGGDFGGGGASGDW